jgi:hypothetical protein
MWAKYGMGECWIDKNEEIESDYWKWRNIEDDNKQWINLTY